MVGRASYGAPWTAGLVAREAGGAAGEAPPKSPEAMAEYVVAHYEEMLGLYGVESGLRQARKHLGWYLDRHARDASPDTRAAIMTGARSGFGHALFAGRVPAGG